MARLAISLLFLCCTLQATSLVFTTCSAGTTVATPCPMLGLSGPGYDVLAQATATEGSQTSGIGGFSDLPGGQGQSAITHAEADISGPMAPPLSANARASDNVTYNGGAGPVRSGFIEFEVLLDYLHQDNESANSPTAMFSDGTHQYIYVGGGGVHGSTTPRNCNPEDCAYMATVPFDLGTTFKSLSRAKRGSLLPMAALVMMAALKCFSGFWKWTEQHSPPSLSCPNLPRGPCSCSWRQ